MPVKWGVEAIVIRAVTGPQHTHPARTAKQSFEII
jgi:hypothetical protein